MMTYSFDDTGCILLRKADATILPDSLSSTLKTVRISDEHFTEQSLLTSQRDDITLPPRETELLTMRKMVPLAVAPSAGVLEKTTETHKGAGA